MGELNPKQVEKDFEEQYSTDYDLIRSKLMGKVVLNGTIGAICKQMYKIGYLRGREKQAYDEVL
jgi:hypothetical protein